MTCCRPAQTARPSPADAPTTCCSPLHAPRNHPSYPPRQIFDKALFEPHFSELYSQLCHTLQKRLPEFDDPTEQPLDEEGGEVKRRKLNFRRLLLNKCQEEFEKGDAAMQAVAEREAKAKERGSVVRGGGALEGGAARLLDRCLLFLPCQDSTPRSWLNPPSHSSPRQPNQDDAEGGDEDDHAEPAEGEGEPAAAEGEEAKGEGEAKPEGEGDREEGETTPPKPPKPLDAKAAALAARRAERAAAELELKGRRRMLGNIQFIGQLYRFGMLTENIMHSCIQRLLQDDQNPKLEDLECLCKLLTTIGQQLERGGMVKGQAGMTQAQAAARAKEEAAKGRKLMDAYFARIQRLVDNKSLDSRLKFMLMDIQEQRSRGWAVRRKAEGPMKIEVSADSGFPGSVASMQQEPTAACSSRLPPTDP